MGSRKDPQIPRLSKHAHAKNKGRLRKCREGTTVTCCKIVTLSLHDCVTATVHCHGSIICKEKATVAMYQDYKPRRLVRLAVASNYIFHSLASRSEGERNRKRQRSRGRKREAEMESSRERGVFREVERGGHERGRER